MDQLKAMQVFVTVARRGGFAPAADALGLSTSSVSRHVGNLEAVLGVQLLHRTTRHVRLTPAGEDVLDHCEAIVGRVEQMMLERQAERAEPSGRLRLTMPHFLAAILMRSVAAEFVKAHPQVHLELVIADRMVNIIEEGFDVALRVGPQPDSTLVARKLLDLHLGVIGAPSYFERRGVPRRPADLDEHNCIIDTDAPFGARWPLVGEHGAAMVQTVRGNVSVSGGAAARDLAVGGVGLTYLPQYLFDDDVETGRLATVLDEHAVDYGGIYVVYPPGRHQGPAIRSLTELLVEHVKPLRRERGARPQVDGRAVAGPAPDGDGSS